MSQHEHELAGPGRATAAQVVAGYLATIAIAGGIVALFWFPARIGPAAILFALLATALGGRPLTRFTRIAVAVSGLGFFFGMTIAVALERPMF